MNQSKHAHLREASPRATRLAAALIALSLLSLPSLAAPQSPSVRAGTATVTQAGALTRIDQGSERAIIDWRSFGVEGHERVLFNQPSLSSATLNRVTGAQVSMIHGRIDGNGQVVLVNPNGIVFGAGSQVNVGGLIATTANVSDGDFLAGRMRFVESGLPSAGIQNHGSLRVVDGGLVVLVAPHVLNSGVIEARLGRIALGAGDTFTLDLYGDGLINLALSPEQARAFVDETGKPIESLISQAGTIRAPGGEVVLVTAPTARAVLDQVINLSGTIQADTVSQENGRIVLLGRGGEVEVSGTVSAGSAGIGGSIDILGDAIHLTDTARIHADGIDGGGSIRIGGAFQGQGTTPRASTTAVDDGARITADAIESGHGGQVVIWADTHTKYAGTVSARGGAHAGDGGQVEISGKDRLDFGGLVDASAPHGSSGFLLLDPAYLAIGVSEASLVSRILRNGTSTLLTATDDIRVAAPIDGRGGVPGGGLALHAGRHVLLDESIVTNDGRIEIAAGGNVTSASGAGLFSGKGAISVSGASGIKAGDLISEGGNITLNSGLGSVALEGNLATSGTGNIAVSASNGHVSFAESKGIFAGAGKVALDSQALVTGLIRTDGGDVDLRSASGMDLAGLIVTNGGHVLAISQGSMTLQGPADPNTRTVDKGIFAGSGTIYLSGSSLAANGPLVTTAGTTLVSTAGDVTLGYPIGPSNGSFSINSSGRTFINQPIQNGASGANVSISSVDTITIERQIGGNIDNQPSVPGGGISLTSETGNVIAKADLIAQKGTISISAPHGQICFEPCLKGTGKHRGIFSNGGNIEVLLGMSSNLANLASGGGNILLRTNQDLMLAGGIATSGGNLRISSNGNIGVDNVDAWIKSSGGSIELSATSTIHVGHLDTENSAGGSAGKLNITLSSKDIQNLKAFYFSLVPATINPELVPSDITLQEDEIGGGEITVPTNNLSQTGQQRAEAQFQEIEVDFSRPSRTIFGLVDAGASKSLMEARKSLPSSPRWNPAAEDISPSKRNGVDETVIFTGGRGLAQMADLGRSGSLGNILDVFLVPLADDDDDRSPETTVQD